MIPNKDNQKEQAKQTTRFKTIVRGLEVAGEVNPTDADSAFDKLLENAKVIKGTS